MEPAKQTNPRPTGNAQSLEFPQQSIGQFNQYEVQQGHLAQYERDVSAFHPRMAWVPLQNRMISIPVEMLTNMERNLTKVVQRTQTNNVTIALSVLQSAVFAFLQFEKASSTWTSKGDDNTQLHNLQKCLDELKQANADQKEVSTHDFSWLVTDENPFVTNARELFEHCAKVIGEFIPLLKGRSTEVHSHEKVQQIAGWTGWKQQAEQINVSNFALGHLLQKLLSEDEANKVVYKEVHCFHQSVAYIIVCFSRGQYPKQQPIEEIYSKSEIQFISHNIAYYKALEGTSLNESSLPTSGGGFFGFFGSGKQ